MKIRLSALKRTIREAVEAHRTMMMNHDAKGDEGECECEMEGNDQLPLSKHGDGGYVGVMGQEADTSNDNDEDQLHEYEEEDEDGYAGIHYLGSQDDDELDEKSPPGWEGTTRAMKKHKEIDNPWALSHWMKNRGAHSHYTKSGHKKKQ